MNTGKTSRPIDPLEILADINLNEGDDLEFKSAKGGLPKSLWETYSAMANSQGGLILLGVEDNGTVTGLKDVTGLKKNFWNTVNNRGKVNINLLKTDDVTEIDHPDGMLLAIHVPRAGRYQRPVFIGQNPLTGTYRRNFEGDYHCSEQEVSRMLADRAEDSADSRILEHFTLDDLDLPSFQQYRHRFASHKHTHPWLSEDDQTLLNKLGGWGRDRRSGLQGVTVAGLLMFGKEEALREALPQYHVDYREKLSEDPEVRWTDRFTIDGTWPGNLFRKGETVVHEAIRETLVNALIHADYHGMGGIVVEKYRERLEFSNPGALLISFDQLLRGNVSECRNKSLQTMFMMIGAGEKAGSGVDKIRRGWASQHWRDPIVTEQVQPDRVQWILPMISMIPEQSLERIRSLFGKRLEKFSKLAVQALVTADIEGRVDNARMHQITGEHPADITRLLQNLVGKKTLIQEGMGRWTRYRLPSTEHYPHKDVDSIHKDVDSIHKDVDSIHKDVDSIHSDEISHANWQGLLEISAVARGNRRLPPKEMERLILRLCQGNWLTRRQLGELLKRNIDGLRSRFLASMVAHGLLRLRYPDKPNRADQAYTAAADMVEET